MKRDIDKIREILLDAEGGKRQFVTISRDMAEIIGVDLDGALSRDDSAHWDHQFELIRDAGFAQIQREQNGWSIQCIDWAGHDFIDSVRDDKIWKQTKDSAKKVGGFTVDLLTALAKSLLKKKLEQIIGSEL